MNFPHSTPQAVDPSQPTVPSKVYLVINADLKHAGKFISASPVTEQMVRAFTQAIANLDASTQVEIITPVMVRYNPIPCDTAEIMICPLTIDLPDYVRFPHQESFNACRDIEARRRWVEKYTGHHVSEHSHIGDHWLPIINTIQGAEYGEVIGEGIMPNSYHQPIALSDFHRQNLYTLGAQLLDSISASPGVYLLQFGFTDTKELIFDRLWPFPAAPAIASLGCQQTDLFLYHWRCLTHRDIQDMISRHDESNA